MSPFIIKMCKNQLRKKQKEPTQLFKLDFKVSELSCTTQKVVQSLLVNMKVLFY